MSHVYVSFLIESITGLEHWRKLLSNHLKKLKLSLAKNIKLQFRQSKACVFITFLARPLINCTMFHPVPQYFHERYCHGFGSSIRRDI